MVAAIDSATSAAERRASFVADAVAARKAMLRSGQGYDANEVHTYLRKRASGEKPARPKVKPWRG